MALLATRPPSGPGSAAGVSIPRSSTSQRISEAEAAELRVAWSAEESRRRCRKRRRPIGASKSLAAGGGGAAVPPGLAPGAAREARAACSGGAPAAAAKLGRWNVVRMSFVFRGRKEKQKR